MRINSAIVSFLVLMLFLSGCAVSYRHQTHKETQVVGDREMTLNGDTDLSSVSLTLDFLYVRLLMPMAFQQTDIAVTDNDGGKDGIHVQQELKMYRLEVPVLSIWNAKENLRVRYPGELRKRQSIELWLAADSNLNAHRTTWYADLGIVYYHYEILSGGFKFGYGRSLFLSSTKGVGRPDYMWDVEAPSWGVGFELTLFAGEFGLEFLEFLFQKDEKHRERYKR